MVLFLYKSIVVFIVISPKWGLFGIINQIYHASVGILIECLPSGRWFSLGLRPRENHLPSGRHSIMAYLYNGHPASKIYLEEREHVTARRV